MEEARPGFAAAWSVADPIEGWLTRAQAAVLYDATSALPPGSTVVEIGSHQGRSTVVLASALPAGGTVVAIDPFDPGWRYGGPDTHRRLAAHLASAGVADRVSIRAEPSRAARASYEGRVDLLYVDGKHDYWTVRDDLRWAGLVGPGGSVLVHDAFSSLGVTTALLRTLLPSRDLAYLGREGSLARLRRERPTLGQRLRVLAELPWWIRNLTVKVALRLRLRRVARALGHDLPDDPY
ncbi:MAG: class I SAM-dependent methyltransferase [Nocardioides sp.]